jgi:hypothetical protein
MVSQSADVGFGARVSEQGDIVDFNRPNPRWPREIVMTLIQDNLYLGRVLVGSPRKCLHL